MAESESTVLIEGASGTGKELFARAIHALSPRRKERPFVAMNCGALPDTLLESELFGYKAGAFTDARQDKPGRFALADGGTIFLDEIGDISPAMQTRLLRVLQERVYEPLGSVEPVASRRARDRRDEQGPGKLVRKGKFREDLFYRIHVVRLELPQLRDRREDIPLLIEHFIAKFNRLQGKDVVGVADEVLARLMEYDYPGNVRELENIIEHAFVLCRGGLIQMPHLPPQLRGPAETWSLSELSGITLAATEQWLIRDALSRHQGNRTAAAKQLGIDPSTLHRKIKSLGIDVPSPKVRKARAWLRPEDVRQNARAEPITALAGLPIRPGLSIERGAHFATCHVVQTRSSQTLPQRSNREGAASFQPIQKVATPDFVLAQ